MDRLRKLTSDLAGVITVVVLLVLVGLLPPDTSMSQIHKTGTLKVCVPTSYPPLVTGEAQAPGIDVEVLRAVAGRLGVALELNQNPSMGRDFNPRNWGLNRAMCEVIAGGVVDTRPTRSFLEISPTYAETGWVVLSPEPLPDLAGQKVAVLTIISGLDRIELSSYLRTQDVAARIVPDADTLVATIALGDVAAGITEALLAANLAQANGWSVAPVASQITRYRLVFGLWKGDLTLKRAMDRAMAELAAEGEIDAILAKYLGAQRL